MWVAQQKLSSGIHNFGTLWLCFVTVSKQVILLELNELIILFTLAFGHLVK